MQNKTTNGIFNIIFTTSFDHLFIEMHLENLQNCFAKISLVKESTPRGLQLYDDLDYSFVA